MGVFLRVNRKMGLVEAGLGVAAAAAVAVCAGLGPSVAPARADDPNMATKLLGRTVFLDPGHQGSNHNEDLDRQVNDGRGGTKACQTTGMNTMDGVPEHTINWNVSQLVKQSLEALGARVVLSRADDTGWGGCVDERAAAASQSGADVAISIHADGGPPAGHGFHFIVPQLPLPDQQVDAVQSGAGLTATKAVRDAYVHAGFTPADYAGAVEGLQTRSDIAAVALTRVPAVFVEMGNGANPDDAKLLETPDGQLRHAIAITTGLVDYLMGAGTGSAAGPSSATPATSAASGPATGSANPAMAPASPPPAGSGPGIGGTDFLPAYPLTPGATQRTPRQPGTMQGFGQPGMGYGQLGMGQGFGQPGMGYGQLGMGQGFGQPGMGYGQSGATVPGRSSGMAGQGAAQAQLGSTRRMPGSAPQDSPLTAGGPQGAPAQPGTSAGVGQPGVAPGYAQPGSTGLGQPGNTGLGQPGTGQGYAQPGTGLGQPNTGQGFDQPGSGLGNGFGGNSLGGNGLGGNGLGGNGLGGGGTSGLVGTAVQLLMPLAHMLGLDNSVISTALINLAYTLAATLLGPSR